MNIFYISEDPRQAAEWMVDKHVVKMILESAQLLSTAHRVLDGKKQVVKTKDKLVKLPDPFSGQIHEAVIKGGRNQIVYTLYDQREQIMYKATHINHPSAIWTRTSIENYNWLVDHFFALCDEYKFRYGKVHKCYSMGIYLQSPPKNLCEYDMTEMPRCMPDEYKDKESVINSYRNYYKNGKKELHTWTKRNPPEWI